MDVLALDQIEQKLTELQQEAQDRVYATDEELAKADECEKHWMHITKVVCIVGKIALVVIMLMLAIRMYTIKYKKCTTIPVMMAVYCLALCLLVYLDMTEKYIAGFFILIYIANYFNFIGFYKILDNLPGAPGKQLKQSTRWYFRLMNVLYVLTLGLAFIPRFGPICTSEKLYPPCMNWIADMFIVNFVFHWIIYSYKDFYLAKGAIAGSNVNQDEEDNDYEKVLDQTCDSMETAQARDADWSQPNVEDQLSKKMFRKQMKIYLWFQAVLAVCNIAIQLWGRIFVHKSHFLGCTDGGYQWLYTSIKGELFVGAHMVLIITQAVMLEQALYQVPKKLGWFNQTVEQVQLADSYPEAKEVVAESVNRDSDYNRANQIN